MWGSATRQSCWPRLWWQVVGSHPIIYCSKPCTQGNACGSHSWFPLFSQSSEHPVHTGFTKTFCPLSQIILIAKLGKYRLEKWSLRWVKIPLDVWTQRILTRAKHWIPHTGTLKFASSDCLDSTRNKGQRFRQNTERNATVLRDD